MIILIRLEELKYQTYEIQNLSDAIEMETEGFSAE